MNQDADNVSGISLPQPVAGQPAMPSVPMGVMPGYQPPAMSQPPVMPVANPQPVPSTPSAVPANSIASGIAAGPLGLAVPADGPPVASWLPPTVPVHPPDTAANPATAAVGSADGPQVAADADLIEREWVDTAKQIVARTKQDPYVQARELYKLRTDYMKKRYDKSVEPAEG